MPQQNPQAIANSLDLAAPQATTTFDRFFLNLQRIQNVLQKLDLIKPLGCTSFNDSRFWRLSEADQQLVLHYQDLFLVDFSQIDPEVADKDEGNKSLTGLWSVIRRLGLRPPSNLFSNLGHEDIIEVYTIDGRQIYRNLQFFSVCSYSLDDLFTIPWFELFNRPQSVTDTMLDYSRQVFSGQITKAQPFELPPHHTIEAQSPERRVFETTARTLSPIFDSSNRVAGILTALNAKLISSGIDAATTIGTSAGDTNNTETGQTV